MESLIQKIKDAGFFLGGSRRMAEKYPAQVIINDGTDWDFCCDIRGDNISFLKNNGFIKIECENRAYWDDLLLDIWKHTEFPIEVLIRKDVEIYKASFEALSAEVFIERLWKSSPIADPNKNGFRESVCAYFNGIFRLHGYEPEPIDETPF